MNDISLLIEPAGSGYLGTLTPRGLGFEYLVGGRRLVLNMESQLDASQQGKVVNWLALEAEIWTQSVEEPGPVGRVEIGSDRWPNLGQGRNRVNWPWRLTRGEIERINVDHSSAPGAQKHFEVRVRGLVRICDPSKSIEDVRSVAGEGSFSVGVSDWEGHLKSLGYSIPPSLADLVGAAALARGYWTEAGRRLQTAFEQVRAGEDYAALESCLGEFEKIVTAPYVAEKWKPLTSGWPAQKGDSVAGRLAALCTYLNRVGHHRSRTDRNAGGDLEQMPLEHWEAELAVADSQVLLCYALRLAATMPQAAGATVTASTTLASPN